MIINRRGMNETHARNERLNLGKERAVRAPLSTARKISLFLIFKAKTPVVTESDGDRYEF